MNRLTATINTSFNEHTALTERLREHACSDPLTGLGNRRHFDSQLHNLVESAEKQTHGAVLLLELHNLEAISAADDPEICFSTGSLSELDDTVPEPSGVA
jgi:GGDEF domain-containing protein